MLKKYNFNFSDFLLKLKLSSKIFLILILIPFLSAQTVFEELTIDSGSLTDVWGKCVADINNDGLTDLIACANYTGGLVWFENPSWAKHTISTHPKFKTDIEVFDIDGDGDLDVFAIFSGKAYKDSLVWFENGNSWTMHSIFKNNVLHDIELVDIDDDGLIDIVGRDQTFYNQNIGDDLYIFKQKDPDTWIKIQFKIVHGEGIKIADINLDGLPDIVINGMWLENTGIIYKWNKHIFTNSWEHQSVYIDIADINSDGLPDIIFAPSEYKGDFYRISWFDNPGGTSDTIWPEYIIEDSVETVHHFVGAADFDNDGDFDVASAEMTQGEDPDEVKIYFNNDNGHKWQKQIIGKNGSHSIRIVDIDSAGSI